jgi:hypothetical protein
MMSIRSWLVLPACKVGESGIPDVCRETHLSVCLDYVRSTFLFGLAEIPQELQRSNPDQMRSPSLGLTLLFARSWFRVVPSSLFLSHFASDRSHMVLHLTFESLYGQLNLLSSTACTLGRRT